MPTATPLLSLLDLGWDDDWAAALAAGADPTLVPGRVSRVDRGISTVLTAAGPVRVPAAAEFSIAVGDWVTLAAEPASPGQGTVVDVLPRRCAFRRVSEGPEAHEQMVAANIDTVFLVDAIDGQLSVRHLERYVALTLQSGAVPVILITKSDLATPEQVRQHLAVVAEAASGVAGPGAAGTGPGAAGAGAGAAGAGVGVAVHLISATTGEGLDALAQYLVPGRTVALLGLSGAGKSTLVNLLAGENVLATGAVRSDGKGRHTTTHRQLVGIPGGGLLIDTPGMRALSVAAATEGVGLVFADMEELAGECGFPDCSHTTEPGCAIAAAVAAGQLSADRLASWRQLRSETPAEDPQVGRLRVVARKRQKATDKATRAEARATQRKLASPPPS